jgi:hypothetical protein
LVVATCVGVVAAVVDAAVVGGFVVKKVVVLE